MAKKGNKVMCQISDIEGGGEKEIDINDLSFRPSVYGVLIEGNKALLSKQWDGYDFPGGGIKIHETIDEALEREFFEETGIKIKKDKILNCESSHFILSISQKPVNAITIYFLVKKIGGRLSKENATEQEKNYIDEPEWVDIGEIDNLKFYNSIDSVKLIGEACYLISK